MNDEKRKFDPLEVTEILIPQRDFVDLIVKLAIENHARGAFEISATNTFKTAVKLFADVWNMHGAVGEHAQLSIDIECDRVDNGGGDYVHVPRPKRAQMLGIFATLVETIVQLDERNDRRAIANLMYFLKEYWSLADELE